MPDTPPVELDRLVDYKPPEQKRYPNRQYQEEAIQQKGKSGCSVVCDSSASYLVEGIYFVLIIADTTANQFSDTL